MPKKNESRKKRINRLDKKGIKKLKREMLDIAKAIDERESELDEEGVEMTAKILYFTSGNTAKMVKKKITDGNVDMGDKMHIVDTSDPIMLEKRLGGFEPMFILKHDEIYPSTNLNPIRPEFGMKNKRGKVIKDRVNPEVLKKTMSMKILGNMLKVKKTANPLLLVLIGLAMGGFLIYYLIMMKVIKI